MSDVVTDRIRLATPDVGEAEIAAFAEVVATGMLTMGPKVDRVRAGRSRRPAAPPTRSSSPPARPPSTWRCWRSAIGPGDEVIVPAYTFPATANVVELCGARAVLVDVDPDTFNVDIARVADAVTPRTKAVLAVHLFGRPVEWEELQTAVPQEVVLVEDAAGALGARYRGYAVWVARPDGLPVVPSRARSSPRARAGPSRPTSPSSPTRFASSATTASCRAATSTFPAPGLNYRLPDLLCAIGIPQLARLEQLLAARERVAGWYTERLEHLFLTPSAAEGDRHGWQAYVIQLDRRDEALHGACGPRGSRCRSGRTRCTTSAPTATAAPSPAPTAPSPGRSRCRSRATMTEAECDRVAAALARFV